MTITELKIRVYGDPVLRKKSKLVKEVGPGERMLVAAMIEAMHHNKGIGLAAPQVGINEQILVADIGDGPLAIINPRILKKSGREVLEEGCLSLPGVNVEVRRAKKIFVSFINESGRKVQKTFEGLLARVILHETDHLHGKLIIDYVSFAQRIKLRPVLKAIRAHIYSQTDNDNSPVKTAPMV